MKRFNYLSATGLHKVFLAFAMALFAIAPTKAQDYLCFSLNGGYTGFTAASIQVVAVNTPDPIELEYSYDKTNWKIFKLGDSKISTFLGVATSVTATGACVGEILTGYTDVYIRAALSTQGKDGINEAFSKNTNNYYKIVIKAASWQSGAKTELSGNIMSLLDASCLRTDVPEYCFYKALNEQTLLYAGPDLPATELNTSCYQNMFNGCTNLREAPNLPATEENLATNCYAGMFTNCSKLNRIQVNFTSWGTNNTEYTSNWVANVASSGDFVCPDELDDTKIGSSNIPNGWRDNVITENNDYLCITPATHESTTISLTKVGSPNELEYKLQYSYDNPNSWQEYTIGETLTLYRKNGHLRVYFRYPKESNTFSKDNENFYRFNINKTVEVSGNVMSLLKWDCSKDSVPDYAFIRLFNATPIKTTPKLPATKLGKGCYRYMFASCKNLYTTEPSLLPATRLNESCYYGMFQSCLGLKDAPELPATTLATSCYNRMFLMCTSLLSAPELPASTLVSDCYTKMFGGCSSLEYIKVGFTNWNPANATSNWATDHTEGGTTYTFPNQGIFVCPENMTVRSYSGSTIPKNDIDGQRWTVSNENEYLCISANRNGSTLKLNKVGTPNNIQLQFCTSDDTDTESNWQDYSWNGTEGHLISLNKAGTRRVYFRAKENNANFSKNSANYYKFVMKGEFEASGNIMSLLSKSFSIQVPPTYAFYRLFNACDALKDASSLVLPSLSLSNNCYTYMFATCTKLRNAPSLLPAVNLAANCYQGMFRNCQKLSTAPQLPAETLVSECYKEMFRYCLSLANAPDLPATTLANNCYANMFDSCLVLRTINVAFTDWGTASNGTYPYTNNWVKDVASSGMFFCPTELPKVTGNSHIPSGWEQNPDLLYFTALEDGYIRLDKVGNPDEKAIQYSTAYGAKWRDYTWAEGESNQTGAQISVKKGNKIFFKAKTSSNSLCKDSENYYRFVISAPMEANGNIVFLLNGNATHPYNQYVAPYGFYGLFYGCDKLTHAPNISQNSYVHAHTYQAMFKGCKNLLNIPDMPATGITESCYESMFEGCESLHQSVHLPATNLAKACYKAMFKGCKSLTDENLQEIDATAYNISNGESALESMFEDCTGLTKQTTIFAADNWETYPKAIMKKMFKGCVNLVAPVKITNGTLNESCFESMYEGCTSLKTAPTLPQTTMANRCYYKMFAGCSSLKNAPDLPAKTTSLKDSCYAYMFNGCTSLKYMDVGFSKWYDDQGMNFSGATYKWVTNVAPVGTFMCPDNLRKAYNENHIPSGWSAEDNGDYLCFKVIGNDYTNLCLKKHGNPDPIFVKYSTDRNNWETKKGSDMVQQNTWLLNGGQGTLVYIKIGEGQFSKDADNYWYFESSAGNISVSGDIMSLIDPTMEQTDVPDYTFYKIFSGMGNHLKNASDLILPATELGAYCYADMFYGCTYLQNNSTTTPALPATTLGNYCYQNLFKDWTALTDAPELPATTLAEGCYSNMFNGCTSLKVAPTLPATQLATACYESLFDGCTQLNKIDVYFKEWLDGATTNWVNGVANEGNIECPWALLTDAVAKWGNEDIDNVYGGSKIPKNASHKWKILLHTDMEMNYATGILTISGGNPIYYSTDPEMTEQNKAEKGTRVDDETYSIDLNAWLNAAEDKLESITYYAIAGNDDGVATTTLNSLTIYRMRKRSGYVMAKSETSIEEALFFGEKVSSKDYPVKIFVPDGVYNLSTTCTVGDWVSLIGESKSGTIINSSAPDGSLIVKGDSAYIQDITFGSTHTNKIAFRDNASFDHTTLHVGLVDGSKYTFNHGTYGTRTTAPTWDAATDPTQATADKFFLNGGTFIIDGNAPAYLVEVWNGNDWDYTIVNRREFYLNGVSMQDKNVQVRAANNRGAFGAPCTTPTVITGSGKPYSKTVKLNASGYASFSFMSDDTTQLKAVGAAAYKGIYNNGVITLTRINDYDIIPRRTGVILFGQPNSTVQFYKDNTTISSPYADVKDPVKPLIGNGNNTISRTPGDGKLYFGLSGNEFRKLSETGTIKPNKAYFDLSDLDIQASSIRIVFGMWEEEEEVVSGINYLPTAGNDSEYSYMLTGVRMKDAKGLVIQNNKVVLIK